MARLRPQIGLRIRGNYCIDNTNGYDDPVEPRQMAWTRLRLLPMSVEVEFFSDPREVIDQLKSSER